MRGLFRTTGMLSLIIWAVFFIIGLTQKRPFICLVSAVFFALNFYRRVKIIKQKDPAKVLWESFSEAYPDKKDVPYEYWVFHTGDGQADLSKKLKSGVVRGQSFSVDFFDANQQPLPSLGDINVLCCDDRVIGICETVNIVRTTFGKVDRQLAAVEGFSTVESWRKTKQAVFELLSERMGMEFSKDMEILFEEFKIIYSLNEETTQRKRKIDQ